MNHWTAAQRKYLYHQLVKAIRVCLQIVYFNRISVTLKNLSKARPGLTNVYYTNHFTNFSLGTKPNNHRQCCRNKKKNKNK